MIGASAGFDLLYDGETMPGGSCRSVLEIAACTSCAAASTLRSRLKVRPMRVDPRLEVEVISSMPEMVENCFSSGVATEDAMVSGLAPGKLAVTVIEG